MITETEDNEALILRLKDLVKAHRNNEIKSIIENSTASDLVDSTGSTLLHLAARYDNVDLIDFLLKSSHNIESKTHSGVTPLLMSAMYRSYDAVKFLLNANANILAHDNNGISTLRVLLHPRRNVPADVLPHIGNRLRKIENREDKMNLLFREAGSRLESILPINDAELVEHVLENTKASRRWDNDALVELAIEVGHVDVIGAVVQCGYEPWRRKKILMQKLSTIMTRPESNLKSVKPIIEQLINWRVIRRASVEPLEMIFREGSQEAVQMIIDCDIDLYVRGRYNCDFLTHMFRNENLDVLELLKNRFDPGEQGVNGYSLLHLAVMYKPISFVQRLLDLGADPNVTNIDGQTPLFYANSPDCMELLLRSGADVEVIDVKGLTIFKKVKDDAFLLDMVIAHVIDRDQVTQRIWDEIAGDEQLKKRFGSSFVVAKCMIKSKIYKEKTIYNLLKATDEELIFYPIQSRDFMDILFNVLKGYEFNSYYLSKLKQKLTRAFEFYKMRFDIATTTAEMIGVGDLNHLVIEKIIGYLSARDILACIKFSK